MMLWILCGTLGVLTIALAPLIITGVIKVLMNYARKYPLFTNVIAIIAVILVGAILIAMSATFAVVYHHLMVGQ